MNTIEKKKLGEAIDYTISHSLINIDGKVMSLGDAIRQYRGGNYLATKWHKCSEQQPKTPRYALVYADGVIRLGHWYGEEIGWGLYQPTHWMNLPLPPVPEDEA